MTIHDYSYRLYKPRHRMGILHLRHHHLMVVRSINHSAPTGDFPPPNDQGQRDGVAAQGRNRLGKEGPGCV